MKSIDEAQSEIVAAFSPLGTERVPLLESLGRFLAEPFVARSDSPPFDNSAMDGYAVLAADIAHASESNEVRLPVRGESRAGGPSPSPLVAGSAMRIFTGAPMPEGADAVVLQEDTARDAHDVLIREAVASGGNVRRRGEDLRQASEALPQFARISSGEIALLASQGVASVPVYRRPRVAVLCTGDELRDIGEPERPGSIISSNGYALAAQIREAGAEPWVLPFVRDERKHAALAIEAALRADVVVISGGVSVGDYDVVKDALKDAGVTLDFWKIRMKPGKPVSFARHHGTPILGLPGNPVSTWVTFELFVRPGLRKMLGDPSPLRRRVRVHLHKPILKPRGRPEMARARLHFHADGKIVAELYSRQGSGSIPSLTQVDALVMLPEGDAHIQSEDTLQALLLT